MYHVIVNDESSEYYNYICVLEREVIRLYELWRDEYSGIPNPQVSIVMRIRDLRIDKMCIIDKGRVIPTPIETIDYVLIRSCCY